MTILRENNNTRINPAELRYLRTALLACTLGCRHTALQSIVVFARLHDGLDLSDEARYIEAEWAYATTATTLLHRSANA